MHTRYSGDRRRAGPWFTNNGWVHEGFVAWSGYREILGLGRACGWGTRYRRVRGRLGRVESGGKVWSFVVVKLGELTSSVNDHGNVLRRSPNSERDSEAHVVVERKLVWRSRNGPSWNYLSFEWQNKCRCLRWRRTKCCSVEKKKRERFEKWDWEGIGIVARHKVKKKVVRFHGVVLEVNLRSEPNR